MKRSTSQYLIEAIGLNGVSRQPSNDIKFTRQPSKMQIIKGSWSQISHGILAPEESLNWKIQFPCSQKTISRQYKILQLANICRSVNWGRNNLQNIINLYGSNIFLNFWTKFPLNINHRYQSSKALKFNRQQSKLKNKNTIKRQS